jgi:hypothetical protein
LIYPRYHNPDKNPQGSILQNLSRKDLFDKCPIQHLFTLQNPNKDNKLEEQQSEPAKLKSGESIRRE